MNNLIVNVLALIFLYEILTPLNTVVGNDINENKWRVSVLNVGEGSVGVGGEISNNSIRVANYNGKQQTEIDSSYFRISPIEVHDNDSCGLCNGEELSYLLSIGDLTRSTIKDVNSILSLVSSVDGELFSIQSNGITKGTEFLEVSYLGGLSLGSKNVRINAQVGPGGRFESGQTRGPIELTATGVVDFNIGNTLRASAKREYSVSPTSLDSRKLDHVNVDFYPGRVFGDNGNNIHLGFEIKKEDFSLFHGTENFSTTYGGLKAGFQF